MKPDIRAKHHLGWILGAFLGATTAACVSPGQQQAEAEPEREPVLHLEAGDHISIIGNTLAEQMQHYGYWETLLHSRFPEHELRVRNLAFPADELDVRLRSSNFGSPEEHLTQQESDVVLAFFGFNESFKGEAGLDAFRESLEEFVEETLEAQYNGQSAPRLALISPIAYENLGNPRLPDGTEINRNIELYTRVMEETAAAHDVAFVDLFTPTHERFANADEPLTFNGAHLNDAGYRALAPILDRALFGTAGTPSGIDENLRTEVLDKNFRFFHRYRALNGYYIYGGRSGLHNNEETLERELDILEEMATNRDARIWARARGEQVPDEVDDSNLSPYIDVETNFDRDIEFLYGDDAMASFTVPDGYELTLFADEQEFPDLANPLALNFDNEGRLWVATMPHYPHFHPLESFEAKLLILEDTTGDGKADTQTVFADELHMPLGFELGDGGVYLSEQPDLMFLKDTTGDGKADLRERLLMGFDSADSHHAISAFAWDPQGSLYFQEGVFHRTQVETPYGPHRLSDGGVFRYTPREHRLDTFIAYRFPNPWGHVFDRYGMNIVTDGTGPDGYYATYLSMRADYPLRHGGAPNFHVGVRPNGNAELIYSRHFPEASQGNFLITNVIGFLGVKEFELVEDGAGYQVELVRDLISSDDPNFRPVGMKMGPDGALYVADWHNPLIGHMQHNLRDPRRDHDHGRIYRLTYNGNDPLEPPAIAGADAGNLLDLLREYENDTLQRVRRELHQRSDDEVLPELDAWLAGLDPDDSEYDRQRLEALWIYQARDAIELDLLESLLVSEEANVRVAATRALRFWLERIDADPLELLEPLVHDEHPRVRLEAVVTLSHIRDRTEEAAALALEVEEHEMDDYLEHALEGSLRSLNQ